MNWKKNCISFCMSKLWYDSKKIFPFQVVWSEFQLTNTASEQKILFIQKSIENPFRTIKNTHSLPSHLTKHTQKNFTRKKSFPFFLFRIGSTNSKFNYLMGSKQKKSNLWTFNGKLFYNRSRRWDWQPVREITKKKSITTIIRRNKIPSPGVFYRVVFLFLRSTRTHIKFKIQ